jgi:hypothetical protein
MDQCVVPVLSHVSIDLVAQLLQILILRVTRQNEDLPEEVVQLPAEGSKARPYCFRSETRGSTP